MGDVYEARDDLDGSVVALKVLRETEANARHQIKREFRALRDLQHPNLVALRELHIEDSEPFFTMELVDGVDFVEHVRRGAAPGEPIDLERAERALIQLAAAVEYVHESGRLHRDLKPGNVLVDSSGRVVVMDFGLSSPSDWSGAASSQRGVAGTLSHLPPEAFEGATPTEAFDAYGVGVLAYQAICGALPFSGPIAASYLAKKRGARPPSAHAAGVPRRWDELVLALLAPEPSERLSCRELAQRLGADPSKPARPRATRSAASVFVGRSSELSALRRAASGTASAGELVRVMVTGPSGIGKTTLCAQFLDELAEQGAVVLRSRCHPAETIRLNGLDGIISDLTDWLRERDDDASAIVDEPHPLLRLFPELARAVGEARTQRPAGDGPLERIRGARALGQLLDHVASEGRVALWIDDAQWCDADTWAVLETALGVARAKPLLLVSARARIDPFRELSASETVCEVPLAPLAPQVARALGSELLGRAQDERLDEICREAEGDPLLLRELTASSEHVRTLEQLVALRVARLDDRARSLLAAIARAGTPVRRDVLTPLFRGAEEGALRDLDHSGLVRSCRRGPYLGLELAHHRLGELVAASASDDARAELHLRLADALAEAPDPERMEVAEHRALGGDERGAARWAERAAEDAMQSLAFDFAHRAFERAAAWSGDDREAAPLRRRSADALVALGRCADAARRFEQLADHGASAASRRELQRLAMENFLATGLHAEGLRIQDDLVRDAELYRPRSSAATTRAILFRIAWLRARGYGFRRRAASEDELREVDLCWSLAKGMLASDPARGALYALIGLLRALRAGDPHRVARHLAAVGAIVLAPAGGALRRWGWRLIERAAAIAREEEDAYLEGFTAVCAGQYHVLGGDWAAAHGACREGVRILSQRCVGVTWETNIGWMGELRALEELGELPEMVAHAEDLRATAIARGDLYAEVTAGLYAAVGSIAQGRPREAAAAAEGYGRRWPAAEELQMQQLYAFRVRALAGLYARDPQPAWAELEQLWPSLERSGLLRFPMSRVDAHLLRARLALSTAIEGRAEHLAVARADVARLTRESRPDAVAHAELLAAATARVEGRPTPTDRLRRAEALFEAAGMPSHGLVCRRALREDDTAQWSRRGVHDPDAWMATIAPGLAPTIPRTGH